MRRPLKAAQTVKPASPASLTEGRGRLTTRNKLPGSKLPNMRGAIVIEGRTYALSAWWTPSKHGPDYLHLVAQAEIVRDAHPMIAGAARVDSAKVASVDMALFGIETAEG